MIKYALAGVMILVASGLYAQDVDPDDIDVDIDIDNIISGQYDTAAVDASVPGDTAIIPSENSSIAPTVIRDAAVDPAPAADPRFPVKQSVISERNDSAMVAKPDAGADLPALKGRYYGLGAGVSLGTIPLFSMWNKSLPDSLSAFGIDRRFGRIDGIDTMDLRYDIIEAPEEFNFFIPFSVSYYDINDSRAVSLTAQFFFNTKQFQSVIYPHLDTTNRRVTVHETMKFYSVSLEAAYRRAIPPVFFSVDGAQKTYLYAMLGCSPLQYFTRDGGVHNSARSDDERMALVADTVKHRVSDFSANGLALSWRFGISTIRSYPSGNGLELGLYYGGAYSRSFYRDGDKVMNSQIHIKEGERDKSLEFVSNRVEFIMTFLIRGKKGGGAAEDKADGGIEVLSDKAVGGDDIAEGSSGDTISEDGGEAEK